MPNVKSGFDFAHVTEFPVGVWSRRQVMKSYLTSSVRFTNWVAFQSLFIHMVARMLRHSLYTFDIGLQRIFLQRAPDLADASARHFNFDVQLFCKKNLNEGNWKKGKSPSVKVKSSICEPNLLKCSGFSDSCCLQVNDFSERQLLSEQMYCVMWSFRASKPKIRSYESRIPTAKWLGRAEAFNPFRKFLLHLLSWSKD